MSTQSSHLVSVKDVQKARVRTGYERVLAHHVGRDFAGVAEQDGKVISIDEKIQMVTVQYKDGTTDTFQYGHKYTDFEGYNVEHSLECIVKQGQTVKKGDIITYNTGHFTLDKYTKQVDFTTGLTARTGFMEMDINLEDAMMISDKLSERLSMNPVNLRIVTLDRKSLIHSCVKVGDHVNIADPLMVFEEQEIASGTITKDEGALALLGDLNRSTPYAKYTGKVIKIDAFYGGPISEMSSTLAPIVRSAVEIQNKRAKAAAGTPSESDYPPSAPLPRGTKYKGVMFDEDTVCLIFYIQEEITADTGDKLVLGLQCKGTIAGKFQMPIFSESGSEIECIASPSAFGRRMVLSATLMGILTRCIEKIEQDACDIYFGDKK